MKVSEYGGSDTDKTNGVQPAPHVPTPSEILRLMRADDNPADPTSGVELMGQFGKA